MANTLPQHVAIIPDGNRTWAVEKGLKKNEGHTAGAKNIKPIVETALQSGVKFLTIYILSTENLQERSQLELRHLFALFAKLPEYLKELLTNSVRVRFIGNLSALPTLVQKVATKLVMATAAGKNMTLTFAINYGAQDEILRAVQKVCEEKEKKVTVASFGKLLDTAELPEVDLMIRTGGYQRLSNFLLWQSAYAELFFSNKKWPEFQKKDFVEALAWFGEQKRKKGK